VELEWLFPPPPRLVLAKAALVAHIDTMDNARRPDKKVFML
jgi:hypothetical protein